jgi:hypothetical protein
VIKHATDIITNERAAEGCITPEGISRFAVLGFFSSYFLSIYLLNPIAALRAKTMHKRISNKSLSLIACPESAKPRKSPIIANGRANMVCANFTREKYLETIEIMLILYLSAGQK